MKNVSSFWRTQHMPLVNWEISLTLTWFENCVLTDMTTKVAEGGNPAIEAPPGAISAITEAKLYLPVVILSGKDDNKLFQQIKTRFKKQLNGINTSQK